MWCRAGTLCHRWDTQTRSFGLLARTRLKQKEYGHTCINTMSTSITVCNNLESNRKLNAMNDQIMAF